MRYTGRYTRGRRVKHPLSCGSQHKACLSTRSAPMAPGLRPSFMVPGCRFTPAPGQSLQLQNLGGLLQIHPPDLPRTSSASAAPGSPQCQTSPLSLRLQRIPVYINSIQSPQTQAPGLPWKTQASGTIAPYQHQASPHTLRLKTHLFPGQSP